MFFDAGAVPPPHGVASFWLDVADRVIKFLALLVGAAWTWMHYRRSRVYAQKLELELNGRVVPRYGLYLEVVAIIRNLGAARHLLQARGTSCTVWAVMEDLSETRVFSQSIFDSDDCIEPGESISDSKVFKIDGEAQRIVWLRLSLRVESEGKEWNLTRHIRVEIVEEARGGQWE